MEQKNGMFGHPGVNTFALVSSIYGFLNDEAYCCVITRNGSLQQVLQDMKSDSENLVLQSYDPSLKECVCRRGPWSPFSCNQIGPR